MRYEFKERTPGIWCAFGNQGSSGETSCSWRNARTVTAGKNRRTRDHPPSTRTGIQMPAAELQVRGICSHWPGILDIR